MTDERTLTWAGLLARWTDFAKAGLALPDTADGTRWKRAIPSIIGLQAVTHALAELHELDDPEERAVGLDRANVLVVQYATEIHGLWSGEDLPAELVGLVGDARMACELAAAAGLEWIATAEQAVFEHPGPLAEALVAAGFTGDLLLPSPGVPLHAGTPAAFLRGAAGGPPDELVAEAVGEFLIEGEVAGPEIAPFARQTYRQFDFAAGGPVRDVIAPLDGEPLAGQPLLVAVIVAGEILPVPLPPRAGGPQRVLPVEEYQPDA